MGVFAEWQPRYAEHGVATFPLLIEGKTKKPATKGYTRTGLKGSEQLAIKFPHIDAFGFMCGRQSGTTILDIDSPYDDDLLRDILKRYGDTPVIVQTGSGGFHCYYRHGDEKRKIRPDPNEPVDLIGGGMAAAAPSQGSRSPYSFIRGSVADLARLPYIKGGADKAEVQQAVQREVVQQGNRNRALFEHLMREAKHVDDLDTLLDVARTYASEAFAAPLPEAEIVQTAKSVWGYESTGKNRFGCAATLTIGHATADQVMALGADAWMLFSYLQRRSNHRAELIVANDMRMAMPDGEWPLRRFRNARASLIGDGVLKEVRKASTYKGPAVYHWQG